MHEPRVSVIIPAFNAASTIGAAIRSVQAQTFKPLEIIVVDDGSTDTTAGFVSAMHPAVKLVQQANQGCGQSRNTGVRAAAGDWLAFLDADDTWLPRKLEKQIPQARDSRVAVVTCRSTTKQGKPLGRQITFDDLWHQNNIIVSSSLVRRSAFEAAGGFWAVRACEDYHLWLRLTAMGWVIANCPEDLAIYAPTVTSLSRQIDSFAAAELACIQDVASQFGIPVKKLRERLVSSYLKHGRGAIHMRKLRLARRFILKSLRYGISAEQLSLLAVACAPRILLDLRRQAVRQRMVRAS